MARRRGPYRLNGKVACSCLLEVELCCDYGVAGGETSKKSMGFILKSNFAVHKLTCAENTAGEGVRFLFFKHRYFSWQHNLLNV